MASMPTEMNAPRFRDRRRSLMLAGILQCGEGLVYLLGSPFILLGMFMSTEMGTELIGLPQALLSLATLLGFSAWHITLGLGSVAYKRWARSLSLAAYGIYVVYILPVAVVSIHYLPVLMQAALQDVSLSSGMESLMTTGMLLYIVVLNVFYPLLILLLYSGKSVKETCERYHPVESWTDKCPFPVLVTSMAFVALFFGVMQLLSASSFQYPFWGWVLSGAAAGMVVGSFALLCIAIAYGLYKMKRVAWIGAWVVLVFFGGSTVFTLLFTDMGDIYALFGITEAYVKDLPVESLPPREVLLACALFWGAALSGALLYAGRFHRVMPEQNSWVLTAENGTNE